MWRKKRRKKKKVFYFFLIFGVITYYFSFHHYIFFFWIKEIEASDPASAIQQCSVFKDKINESGLKWLLQDDNKIMGRNESFLKWNLKK